MNCLLRRFRFRRLRALRPSRQACTDRRGAAVVELAALLPLLIFLFVISVDLARPGAGLLLLRHSYEFSPFWRHVCERSFGKL
jgi:hypothetical protein